MRRALLLGCIGAMVVLVWSFAGCGKKQETEQAAGGAPKKQAEEKKAEEPKPAVLENDVVAIPEGFVVSPDNDKAPGEPGYRIWNVETNMEMLYVPAGKFTMGAEGGQADESPVREVEVSAFWIGATEVTRAQWMAVMSGWTGHTDDTPASDISWDDAVAFCKRTGLRLPSEAEWEFAARGPEGRVYPWGDEWDPAKCCNAANKGEGGSTFPAGNFADGASWCGALDMAGSVAEWCTDFYAAGYRKRAPRVNPAGASASEAKKYRIHTIGTKALPMSGAHVVRGGSWFDDQPGCFRSAVRAYVLDWEQQRYFTGLRVARDLAPEPKPAPKATASEKIAKAEKGPKAAAPAKGGRMVRVPAGGFTMGPDAFAEEAQKGHKVVLSKYLIDKTEVTNTEYGIFLNYIKRTGNHDLCHPKEGKDKDHTPKFWDDGKRNGPQQPVVGVDWYDAFAYAAWAGKRLPTEAEWEKAARGTDGRKLPWGNKWDKRKCRNLQTKSKLAAKVGSYPGDRSPYGCVDMGGNVREWCADWYLENYYEASPTRDPAGPKSGKYRVYRGGSLQSPPFQCVVAGRGWGVPAARTEWLGFRCARTP